MRGSTYVARGKGATEKGKVGVGTDSSKLLGQLKGDGLVQGAGISGGSILVLGEGGNLGIDSLVGAKNALDTDTASVPLNGLEQESSSHATNVLGLLGVGESLIGSLLLETVEVGDLTSTLGGGSVTQKTEDGVLDSLGVVQVEQVAGDGEHEVVRVLLRNLSLVDVGNTAIAESEAAVLASRRSSSHA